MERKLPSKNEGQKLTREEWLKLQDKATIFMIAVLVLALVGAAVLVYLHYVMGMTLWFLGMVIAIIGISALFILLSHLNELRKEKRSK